MEWIELFAKIKVFEYIITAVVVVILIILVFLDSRS